MLVFVVGSGRCGSTLVAELVARHPSVGFVSNLDDKLSRLDLDGRWNNSLFRRAAPRDPRLLPFRDRRRLLERGRLRIAPSEGWELLDRQISPIFSKPCRDLLASDLTPWLRRRVEAFFGDRAEAQGSPVFMHHLTGWPRSGLLRATFPDARFVHVVRDGRAVANSWLQMGWWDGYQGPSRWYLGPLPPEYAAEWDASGRSFVVLAGLGWKMLMDAFAAARAEVPTGQWLDVRYEDLLAEPRGRTEAILRFLDLEWTEDFDRGFSRHVFQRHRGEAFRRDLGAEGVRQLDRVLAQPLDAYGYRTADGSELPVLLDSEGQR